MLTLKKWGLICKIDNQNRLQCEFLEMSLLFITMDDEVLKSRKL